MSRAVQAPTPEPMTSEEAQDAILRFRSGLNDLIDLAVEMYTRQAHLARGYDDWNEFVRRELNVLGIARIADLRTANAFEALKGSGMTQRQIAATAGVGQATVSRELKGADADPSGSVSAPEERQAKVIELTRAGRTNAEIATEVGVTERTVRRTRQAAATAPAPAVSRKKITVVAAKVATEWDALNDRLRHLMADDRVTDNHEALAEILGPRLAVTNDLLIRSGLDTQK